MIKNTSHVAAELLGMYTYMYMYMYMPNVTAGELSKHGNQPAFACLCRPAAAGDGEHQ